VALPILARDLISVVVRGTFNPSIFSPAWMHAQDLVGDAEYAATNIEVIVPELAIFQMGWLRCQVTQQDLMVSTNEPEEFERVRDVVVSVLRILHHTPIRLMGVNRHCHFEVGSADEWHAIGDALAPKAPWENALRLPGMKSITIWGVRPDKQAGRIQVKVEPSNSVQPYGISIAYNDHYELVEVDEQPTNRDEFLQGARNIPPESSNKLTAAIDVLAGEWSGIMDRSEVAIKSVWELRRSGHGA
jgi:hypothetical protein